MKRLLLVLGLSFAWNCPGAMAAPANSSGSTAASSPRNAGLAKVFRKGLEAFEQKRYGDAIESFRQVLSKQPDHTPSKIYLARSLYQQKNLVDALKTFRDIDVKQLEADAAYDYGQTAYRSGDYTAAIKAFAVVPNGHPLYDLAGYYGGISAYKTGEYQHAIDLFDQAVVLPSKLVRSQKLYRLESEKKLFQKQKAEVQATGIPMIKGSKKDASPQVAFIEIPRQEISLTHRYKNQTSEAKKGKSQDVDMQRTTLALSWGSEPAPASAKSQWLYYFDLQGASVKDNEQELLIMPTPSDTLENSTLLRFKPTSLLRTEVGGGYETAVGSTSTFGVLAGAYAYAADGDFSDKLQYSPYISLFFSQKGETLETLLSASTHPRFDSEKLLITQTVQDGSLLFNLTKTVFLGLKGQLNEYNYNTSRLGGPDWNGRGQLEIGYRKPKVLNLALGAFYEVAQGWRLYDATQELPLVKFNLSQSGAYVRADISLTDWWSFGFNAKFAQNSFANVLPEEGEDFPISGETYLDENHGSSISQFALYTTLSHTF